MIVMDCFTKWLEVYTIPDQEATTVVGALVINFFRWFTVLRELHSDWAWNL
jgi:hypothetical protein